MDFGDIIGLLGGITAFLIAVGGLIQAKRAGRQKDRELAAAERKLAAEEPKVDAEADGVIVGTATQVVALLRQQMVDQAQAFRDQLEAVRAEAARAASAAAESQRLQGERIGALERAMSALETEDSRKGGVIERMRLAFVAWFDAMRGWDHDGRPGAMPLPSAEARHLFDLPHPPAPHEPI